MIEKICCSPFYKVWLTHCVPAEMLRDVEVTLTGALPCIHEIDPINGEHTTSEAAPEGAANYVHTGTLTRLSEEQDAKIQTQVFNPVDKWISEVDVRHRHLSFALSLAS